MTHPDLSPLARMVHDTLLMAACDLEIRSDLLAEDIMALWLLSGVMAALADRGVATRCLEVRVFNHPLKGYPTNLALPDACYRLFSYLEADGIIFDLDDRPKAGQ